MRGPRGGLHVLLFLILYHLCVTSVLGRQSESAGVGGSWKELFRQKRDLHRVFALEPFLRKINELQQAERRFDIAEEFSVDLLPGRSKRAAGDSGTEVPYNTKLSVEDLPAKFKLHLKLGEDAELDSLRPVMATMLRVPESHIYLAAAGTGGTEVEMAVLSVGRTGFAETDFLSAKKVESDIANSPFSDELPGLHVRELYVRDVVVGAEAAESDRLSQASLAYIVGGSAMVFVAFILLTIWCYLRSKRVKPSGVSGHSSPSPPAHVPQQICLYPTATPQVKDATLIQPDVTQILTNKSCGECGTPVHTPPLRMKGKGLLERRLKLQTASGRGSNASLTLDLGPPTPDAKLHWGSPPKESTAEEYLLSAGNRMSRKQLRNCLRNTKLLYEEFWEIPMNHPDRVVVPGSGMKNRYRTIIPNEHTRVVLPEQSDDALSSYFNANYMRGYAGEERAFIATQGPMSHTVNDFWRAAWHVRSPIVVMITKLTEKNKTKCENYMPESGSASYGDITITVESVTEKEGYILRQLTLQHLNERHTVLHYWYTAWPDHKAPDTARQLLELVKEVERHRTCPQTRRAKGPVIIHCSAGIGRTGCFIAASIGMRQLQEEHMVDILGIVCQMRLDRGGMVQTNEQYEFVHHALCLYEKELPHRPPSGD